MEDVYDLLAPRGNSSSSSSSSTDEKDARDKKGARLKLRETVEDGVVVEVTPRNGVNITLIVTRQQGLVQLPLASLADAIELMRLGEQRRAVACTDMNAASSRSHAVISVTVDQTFPDGSMRRSKVNFADLAGGYLACCLIMLAV
jgi:ribonuclease PH